MYFKYIKICLYKIFQKNEESCKEKTDMTYSAVSPDLNENYRTKIIPMQSDKD